METAELDDENVLVDKKERFGSRELNMLRKLWTSVLR